MNKNGFISLIDEYFSCFVGKGELLNDLKGGVTAMVAFYINLGKQSRCM
jgi:hypothetical protein